jgi:UDP-GlcNAc:undecaprenyl-phosphate GlcNAc-1-phosphate transferase
LGIVITNSLNLLDNMDGLAPGVAAMSALAFFAISATRVTCSSRRWRRPWPALPRVPAPQLPPARVFLGDAGSLLVGSSSPRWV